MSSDWFRVTPVSVWDSPGLRDWLGEVQDFPLSVGGHETLSFWMRWDMDVKLGFVEAILLTYRRSA